MDHENPRPILIMGWLNLLNVVRYCPPMTIYLPVPAHLAYVVWVRVKQERLAQLAGVSTHLRTEAARRMAYSAEAEAEAVVTLVADLVPQAPGEDVLRVRLATFEQRSGDGLLVPGVHGSGRAGSKVLVVGAGPSIEQARLDLFERVASLLRPEGNAPTAMIKYQ